MKEKTNLPLHKLHWHPSPMLGQIALVTTCNEDGSSNLAPKSSLSMMFFDPAVLVLGCNLNHRTAQNIQERKEFIVNIPGAELAEVVWTAHSLPHPRPVEAAGLTPIPALKVAPPRVEECKAHLECIYEQHLTYGKEVMFLGKVVAISIDQHALSAQDPYEYLQLFAFMENSTYGVIEGRRMIAQPRQ